MGYSSLSLLHLVCPLEETITFFFCGFKYFHGSLPDSPKQRLPQARTAKVRHNNTLSLSRRRDVLDSFSPPRIGGQLHQAAVRLPIGAERLRQRGLQGLYVVRPLGRAWLAPLLDPALPQVAFWALGRPRDGRQACRPGDAGARVAPR